MQCCFVCFALLFWAAASCCETHSCGNSSSAEQARFNVELEIILPRDMTVQESHDLSLELQHKVRVCCGLGILLWH